MLIAQVLYTLLSDVELYTYTPVSLTSGAAAWVLVAVASTLY